MRLLIVTTSWPAHVGDPSGHFVRAEARELERAGHRVIVVRPEPRGAFGWPGVAARIRENPLRAIDAMRWIATARRDVARLEVDRIVAHWALPGGWPIAAAHGAPLEIVSHGGDVRLLAALPAGARDRIAGTLARRATVWRFVSDALLEELGRAVSPRTRRLVERVARVEAARLELPDVGGAIAWRRRDLEGRRVAVSVGRLVASKRVDRAIEHVARARDLDAIVVVGDGPERERLERLARERGVDARFVGKVPHAEALAWIGAAHVVLHASEKEGLSTVLREAEGLGARVEVV
jgi:teichuronic acid biosynthesis glycosyltransferase TuaC